MLKLVLAALLALTSPAFAQQGLIVPPSIVGTSQRGQLPATATNDNASAGNVGEYVSASIASGSAVPLTTDVAANISSISLTAGDWDVWISGRFAGGATTTIQRLVVSASLVSATLDGTNGRIGDVFLNGTAAFIASSPTVGVEAIRLSLSSTTTVFFVAQCSFSVSTCSAFGIIQARRIR